MMRRDGLFLAWSYSVFLAYAGLFVYALHPLMGYTAMTLPAERSLAVASVLPQGWKFFTRDPREDHTRMYRLENGSWVEATLGPNFSPGLAFGLSRRARAQGVESARILQQFNDTSRVCEGDVLACLRDTAPGEEVRNASPAPTLCGDVAIVFQGQVPWAWRHAETPMPSRIARMRVRCG